MVLGDIDQNRWSLGLERVKKALDRLGRPEKTFRHVLVAGTNGKGSTCIYLERILVAAGFSVGTTLSPHISSFSERFRIGSCNVNEKELARVRSQIGPRLEDIGLTYFEWCVVLAAQIFAENSVDIAIFEIGLGGRFDASNVMDPEVSIITEISLDHTEYLGDETSKIALEKAAIARPGR
ncbi:MAG TPA: Mur ligase family protein, partial [Deltaproteobacteria bacterium]|nr:Mur ligase family protein [Deltaproteobacteria bacterium]